MTGRWLHSMLRVAGDWAQDEVLRIAVTVCLFSALVGARDARLTRVLPNAKATGHEVIDLRALRPLAMRGLEGWNPRHEGAKHEG